MSVPLQIGDHDLQGHRLRALLRDDPQIAAQWGIAMLNLMGLIDRLEVNHGYDSDEVCSVMLEIQAAAMSNATRRRAEGAQ